MAETTLTKTDEKQLEKFAADVEAGKLTTIDGMIAIGLAVKGARDLTAEAGCKGRFTEWVESRCQFSRTTAYHYIAIADQFGNCKVTLRFQDGTIPRLAKSEGAAKEAKQLAANGKTITPELTDQLLKKHSKPKPETRKDSATIKAGPGPDAPACKPDGQNVETDSNGAGADTEDDPPRKKMYERDEEPTDPNGAAIPKKCRPAFELQGEFRAVVQAIGKVKTAIENLLNTPADAFLSERFQQIKTDLENAAREVKFSMPFQVCPYCGGSGCKRKGSDKTPCRETGWTVKGIKGTGE